ncbi:Bug family tripartite tricarboxylate transporter substrate binding protein [Variovorax saccharolyticus]|uniref:Bug family tripartite tricarboxylate transporter substrate binding protein n=1 Tax=Variovorax saccharolyticus TaxID=3053516 RepID=UPI00257502E6|nr:tripartite tricarboxylate transporter substrate binding protein [Variovorax sp. J31P216]MDM0029051.1 tripartite tricarboxylate transporter substrate binding protein [Variovorax sp. J31P216]
MNFARLLVLAVLASAAIAAPLRAEEAWPARPVRMVIGTTAGTGGDVLLRLVANSMSQSLMQPVIVENKVGANGLVATADVANSRPDGYTVLFGGASATVINQALQPALAVNVLDKLSPVAQLGAGGVNLVVAPDFPATNLREFIAHAKAHPGQINYATWGVGSSGHLVMEWLKNRYGLNLSHVPYKSTPQIYQDMAGGLVKVAFVDAASSVPLVKAGKIKALGNSGTARAPGLADVLTFKEQDVDFAVDGWYGVFVPRATPDAVVSRLHREIIKVLADPEIRARMLQLNLSSPPPKSSTEFKQIVAADLKVWQSIVRTNAIKVD